MKINRQLGIFSLDGFPVVEKGNDLGQLIVEAVRRSDISLMNGDVVVIAQKVISKAEGRLTNLSDVVPSPRAGVVANDCRKDPRLVELILEESEDIVRCAPGVLIVRHKLGYVMANAGIDKSNIGCDDDAALLLPLEPDVSAENIRFYIRKRLDVDIGVVINDSFGRPFRRGTTGVCIGCSGLSPLNIKTGQKDLFGRELEGTEIAIGDEIAAAASLVMGQADEGTPVVIVRGLEIGTKTDASHSILIRPKQQDLFK